MRKMQASFKSSKVSNAQNGSSVLGKGNKQGYAAQDKRKVLKKERGNIFMAKKEFLFLGGVLLLIFIALIIAWVVEKYTTERENNITTYIQTPPPPPHKFDPKKEMYKTEVGNQMHCFCREFCIEQGNDNCGFYGTGQTQSKDYYMINENVNFSFYCIKKTKYPKYDYNAYQIVEKPYVEPLEFVNKYYETSVKANRGYCNG